MKPKKNRARRGTHASGVQHARGVRTRVGVDTGGTFTDFVFEPEGELRVFKLASTPDDPSRAIIAGLRRIAVETDSRLSEIEVVHGTTVGTNAVCQRRGARAGRVTAAEYGDVSEIGEHTGRERYNVSG